jgi:hypothetical protein
MANYQKNELSTLIRRVRGELKNRHYSDSYIGEFITIWNRLTEYLKKRGTSVYSAKIGLDFLEAKYGITVFKKLSQKDKLEVV